MKNKDDEMKYIIAYDLGTGGMKASLFDQEGNGLESSFVEAKTYYPADDFREQKPTDWWEMLKFSTKNLLEKVAISKEDILGIGISGHSLGVVPIGKDGTLLKEFVPIWSDARATKEKDEVFIKIDEDEWYLKTGNGFPAQLYSAFKILWYKNNEPDIYEKSQVFLGTKDYLNYLLTGRLVTDRSYASGSGVYNLKEERYDVELINAMELRNTDFPQIIQSSEIVGKLKSEIALELGLSENTIVAGGGVDNACMAAGAGCVKEGMAYTSLGTSGWVAVCSSDTKVDVKTRPYTFAHLVEGMYVPAEAIFSAGNTFRWVRDTFCPDLVAEQKQGGDNAYDNMTKLAKNSTVGANGMMMTPHLAGGSALDRSLEIRGSFVGLDLKHNRNDVLRATLEGICMSLKICLEELEKGGELAEDMLIVGGGVKSEFWRSLFADIYQKNIVESKVGENAGSLGAMATAAIATGLWKDYEPLIQINKPISKIEFSEKNVERYEEIYQKFKKTCEYMCEIATL